eukprot:1848701-Amphidinium_carterae.2
MRCGLAKGTLTRLFDDSRMPSHNGAFVCRHFSAQVAHRVSGTPIMIWYDQRQVCIFLRKLHVVVKDAHLRDSQIYGCSRLLFHE